MFKPIPTLLLIVFSMTSVACAETPAPLVQPEKDNKEKVVSTTKKALFFQGKLMVDSKSGGKKASPFPCNVFLTVIEEEDGHHFVAQLDGQIHGEDTMALELAPYSYDPITELYSADEKTGDTLALVGLNVHETKDPDPNKIPTYEQKDPQSKIIPLENSLEIIFSSNLDVEELQEIIEGLNENKSSQLTAKQTNDLNQVTTVIYKTFHKPHVDTITCGKIENVSVKEKVFNFEEGEHGSHSHDH